jgi:hypothetical protein
MKRELTERERTSSLHPAGPGGWSFSTLTRCSGCGKDPGAGGSSHRQLPGAGEVRWPSRAFRGQNAQVAEPPQVDVPQVKKERLALVPSR